MKLADESVNRLVEVCYGYLAQNTMYRMPNGPDKHLGCWQLGTASRYRRSAAEC